MPGASVMLDPTPRSEEPSAAEEGAVVLVPRADDYAAVQFAEIDEAEIVERYAPTVKSLAGYLKGRLPESVQLEDLVQAGMIAVLRLMRVGNLDRNGEGTLRRSIMNAMIDEARREAWAPVRTIRRAKAAALAMRNVEQRLGRHGTDDELAAEMGISLAEYHQLLTDVAGIRLLDLEEFADGEGDLPNAADNPEAAVQKGRIISALTDAVAALPDREKLVVSLYYERALNMDEIGAVLGLDKSTVCRSHGRALLMLRGALKGWR